MESGRVPEPNPVGVTVARSKIERFGRYYLLERIGKGGMAEVFRAVTQGVEGFRRTFVVKRILAEKSGSRDFIRMFGDEARISALLHHPNIVQVYDFGQIDGSYFLVMEYLLGKDLSSVMRVLRGSNLAMPPGLAAFVAHEVAIGLGYAHALKTANGEPLGIVHRDVTPANIMLLHAGGVKVLDFGIAKATAAASTVRSSGRVKGKVGYLSPEQARGENVDGRSDIFALGITLWEMLTGKRLFAGANELETLRNVLQRPVPAPSTVRPGVPPDLDRVVLRMLERDRERRQAKADDVADELEQILRDTHYESQSLRRLLRELFGEESSSSADIPDLPAELAPAGTAAEAPRPRADAPSMEIDVVETAPARTRSLAPPFGVSLTSSRAPAPSPRVRSGVVAAVLALGACLLAYAALRNGKEGPPPPTPALSIAAAAPVAAAPALARALPPAADTIRFELDSQPRGANVLGSDGVLVGITPLSLSVPRASGARTFTIAKAGYHDAAYELDPSRDSSAFIELQRAHHSSRPEGKARRGARARDLGDGLTIDPF